MGLLSRLKSLDGFSQRPLQEKGGNSSNLERLQTHSFNEELNIVHNNGHSGRRASESIRSISSSSGIHSQKNQNKPRPRTALTKAQTDQTINHHSRKRSVTNPHSLNQNLPSQSGKIESGLPIPFRGIQTSSDEENVPSTSYASSSRSSLQLYNGQRKGSVGSIPSLNVSASTAGSPFSMIEGEVVENSTFPAMGSLVTSSLRSSDTDSPRLFNDSWHSPNPSPYPNPSARFTNSSTADFDDEGMAEEIVDDEQSNDTMYGKINEDRMAKSRMTESFSLYSNGVDSSSQMSFNKGSLGTSTLRKASSRLKSGFMRSTKRPSTADASMTDRQAVSWDSTRRRGSHGIFQSSSDESNSGLSLRLGIPRRSTDSLTSTISVGSRNTMTRSTTILAPQATIDSKLPSPDQEIINDEEPVPTSSRQRARASSSTSSHSIRAAIRASLTRPTSRSGTQTNNQDSQEVRSSPLVSPKAQNFEFVSQNSGHSPAMNSTSLPSFAGQQQRAKQRLLSADQLHSEGMIFRNPGFEKISLSPAPRKRSKSRTSRSSNEFEKSIENAEPVPEIPSQYRDERRSSIATISVNSDHANESTLSSEDCDSIDHRSINDEIPGFRSSISTTTTSAHQHTPQSSISGSSSMAHLYSNEKQFGGGEKDNNEGNSLSTTSRKTQTIDSKYQLLTPESFTSTSRSRMREIQNISSHALRLNDV